MKLLFLALAGLAGSASAACPNMCSGHGSCGNDDICHCYQDWLNGDEDGGDCSKRSCPKGNAWVDTPTEQNKAHALAECSNQGICDRDSGDCQCFDGYTGLACKRTVCPNDCSGHGTCEFLKELRNDLGDNFKMTGDKPTTDQFQHELTLMWDNHKSRACVCDPKWTDIDCSRRMCPKGNYALYYDAGMGDTDVSSAAANVYQEVQTVEVTSQCNIPLSGDAAGASGRVWGLADGAYTLKTAGTALTSAASYTGPLVLAAHTATNPTNDLKAGDIVLLRALSGDDAVVGSAAAVPTSQMYATIDSVGTGAQAGPGGTATEIKFTTKLALDIAASALEFTVIPKANAYFCNNVEFALTFRSTLNEEFTTKTLRQTDSAATVQQAINSLPNKVIEEAVVSRTTTTSDMAMLAGSTAEKTTYKVTFFGSMNTGDQYQLECRTKPCGAGCNPRISNVLDAQIMDNSYAFDNYDMEDADYTGRVYGVGTLAAADITLTSATCPAGLKNGMNVQSATLYAIQAAQIKTFSDVTGSCVVTLLATPDGPLTITSELITFVPAAILTFPNAQPAVSKYLDLVALGATVNKLIGGAVTDTDLFDGSATRTADQMPQVGDTVGALPGVGNGIAFGSTATSIAAGTVGTGVFTAGTYVTAVTLGYDTATPPVVNSVLVTLNKPTSNVLGDSTNPDVVVFARSNPTYSNYGVARDVTKAGSCTVTDDNVLDVNSPKRPKALNTECSTRGHCAYDTGICQCFEGYTDEYCSTQAALI